MLFETAVQHSLLFIFKDLVILKLKILDSILIVLNYFT